MHGSENPDTWKAFVERTFKLLDNNGCVSIRLTIWNNNQ